MVFHPHAEHDHPVCKPHYYASNPPPFERPAGS